MLRAAASSIDLSAIHGIVFKAADGEPSSARRRGRCCPISIAQPYPDRDAIDLPRYLNAWRERHGIGTGVAHHRARLSVHLHLVQPIRVRRDASPAIGRQRRRRSRSDRRSLSPRAALVRRRCVRDPSRTGRSTYAQELEQRRDPPAVRMHLARRAHRRRRGGRAGEPGLLPRLDRIGERLAARCSMR